MDVRPFDDAGLFAEDAAAYLDSDPFSASVIAVLVGGVLDGVRPQGPEDQWWTLGDDGRVVGLAMHTPPHNLFLTRMPSQAAVALAKSIAESGRHLPGVNGELQAVRSFAATWRQWAGRTSATAVSMRMYRLAELVVPTGVAGHARPAQGRDVAIVAAWLSAFHDEAQPHAPQDDWPAVARRRIGVSQFCLWQDGEQVVSMAGFSAPVAGVARVGPVYTPPNRRNRGYGAAVTAHATARVIEAGAKHVVLYTDLSNPTSNAIYQAIGYQPDHDAEEQTFDP